MGRRLSVDYLRERWIEARLLGLWNLLFVALVSVPCIGSILLIGQGVNLLHADVPGSVTIASCEHRTRGGWDCHGPFAATDGSVQIDWVRLYPNFAQEAEPSGTVAARVSGPDATQADWSDEPEVFPVPLWGGIAMGLGGLYWVYLIYLTPGDVNPAAGKRRGRR